MGRVKTENRNYPVAPFEFESLLDLDQALLAPHGHSSRSSGVDLPSAMMHSCPPSIPMSNSCLTLQPVPIIGAPSSTNKNPRATLFSGQCMGTDVKTLAIACDCRTARLQPVRGAMTLLTSASWVPARSGRPFSRCFLGSCAWGRADN